MQISHYSAGALLSAILLVGGCEGDSKKSKSESTEQSPVATQAKQTTVNEGEPDQSAPKVATKEITLAVTGMT